MKWLVVGATAFLIGIGSASAQPPPPPTYAPIPAPRVELYRPHPVRAWSGSLVTGTGMAFATCGGVAITCIAGRITAITSSAIGGGVRIRAVMSGKPRTGSSRRAASLKRDTRRNWAVAFLAVTPFRTDRAVRKGPVAGSIGGFARSGRSDYVSDRSGNADAAPSARPAHRQPDRHRRNAGQRDDDGRICRAVPMIIACSER